MADFMTLDLEELGSFDVVLFLGVLYHMRHPLLALERLAGVTGELAVIETYAAVYPGLEHHAMCEFFEGQELGDDPTNWWGPNLEAITGMCRAAGFTTVDVVQGPPSEALRPAAAISPWPYRAVVHARK